MCNLYCVVNRYVGNLPPMPGVFPDYPAPVVRNAGAEREMVLMRWGMPPPPRTGGPSVTNIRNTSSPHWRGWLKPENRSLVPFNSFAEYAQEPNPETKKDVVWFALNDQRQSLPSGENASRDDSTIRSLEGRSFRREPRLSEYVGDVAAFVLHFEQPGGRFFVGAASCLLINLRQGLPDRRRHV